MNLQQIILATLKKAVHQLEEILSDHTFSSSQYSRKQKLNKLLWRKRHQITSLSSTSFSSNSFPKKMTKLAKANQAFKLLEGAISSDLFAFIKKQVSFFLKKKQGRRYDDSFKA